MSFGGGALALAVVIGGLAYCRRRVQDRFGRRLGGGLVAPPPSAEGENALPGSSPPESAEESSVPAENNITSANGSAAAEPEADISATSPLRLPPPPTPASILSADKPLALSGPRAELVDPPGVAPPARAIAAGPIMLGLPAPPRRLALLAPPVECNSGERNKGGRMEKQTFEDVVQGEGITLLNPFFSISYRTLSQRCFPFNVTIT